MSTSRSTSSAKKHTLTSTRSRLEREPKRAAGLAVKSVNRVVLLGHATWDAELKSTTNGQPVCTFGLATNRVWRDQAGERHSQVEYHTLVAWGKLAEFCGEYIKKGKPLYIEGALKTRNWEGEGGTKLYRTEIMVDNVVLLGSREPEHTRTSEEEVAAE